MRAVVLASGGLDSTVAAAVAKRDGCELYFLTIHYGQRHAVEVQSAQAVGRAMGVAGHTLLQLDLRLFGGSSLTTDDPVPKDRLVVSPLQDERPDDIPSTYVPARNTIFLALATAYAETVLAQRIYIGANVVDYSGYPDCRPDFLRAFETVARLGTKQGRTSAHPLEIHAPLLALAKKDIILLGVELQAPLQLTHSCYDPGGDGRACGHCDSCVIRHEGFRAAGMADPAVSTAG